MHDFTFTGTETNDGSRMVGFLLQVAFFQLFVCKSTFVSERFVELDNEVVLEILGHSTTVTGGVADYLVLFRNYFYVGTLVKCVYYNVRVFVFRKGETEQNRTFCRSHFGHYIVFGQIYFIVGRGCYFTFMTEPTGTFFFIKLKFACDGHDGELSVIIDPWAGLVGLLESPDFVGCIRVLPSVPHLARLRCPEVHSPRTCNSGIGVPG